MGKIVLVGDLLVTPVPVKYRWTIASLNCSLYFDMPPPKSRRPTFGVQFTAARFSSSRLASRRHAARAYWPHSSSLSRFENVHPQLAAAGFFLLILSALLYGDQMEAQFQRVQHRQRAAHHGKRPQSEIALLQRDAARSEEHTS